MSWRRRRPRDGSMSTTTTVDSMAPSHRRLIQEEAAAWDAYAESVYRRRSKNYRQVRFERALALMTEVAELEESARKRASAA